MDGAVVFYNELDSEPIYFEACPYLSSDEELGLLIFAPSRSSEDEIHQALSILVPSLQDKLPSITKVGEYPFINLGELPAKEYRLLFPPQIASLFRELRDIYSISFR